MCPVFIDKSVRFKCRSITQHFLGNWILCNHPSSIKVYWNDKETTNPKQKISQFKFILIKKTHPTRGFVMFIKLHKNVNFTEFQKHRPTPFVAQTCRNIRSGAKKTSIRLSSWRWAWWVWPWGGWDGWVWCWRGWAWGGRGFNCYHCVR